jgi:putative membrane protein
MKSLLVSITIALPLIAWAADNPDAKFYKSAAEGGIAEVELGNLAQKKSENSSVKDFGAMMVSDHSAANDKLKSIASSKDVKLPTSPSVGQMATKTKLEVLSGKTFDNSYIKSMIKDHEETIAMFKREIAEGQDPDAKAFATKTLPTLQGHLKKIESIAAAAGVTRD